jgi:hypothetical protein
MEIVDVIKEWAGVGVAVCAAIYGVVKYIHDFRNGREAVRQNKQHTEQEKLATEEKELDLDSRRVKASEEVASEALETLAETREENLNLLDEKYNLRKAVIKLTHRVDALEKSQTYAYRFVCFEEGCELRRPPICTYKPKCLKEEKNGGESIHS